MNEDQVLHWLKLKRFLLWLARRVDEPQMYDAMSETRNIVAQYLRECFPASDARVGLEYVYVAHSSTDKFASIPLLPWIKALNTAFHGTSSRYTALQALQTIGAMVHV